MLDVIMQKLSWAQAWVCVVGRRDVMEHTSAKTDLSTTEKETGHNNRMNIDIGTFPSSCPIRTI